MQQTASLSPETRHSLPKRRRIGRWLRRLVIGGLILFGVLLMAGAIYQIIGTARDRQVFPPPGQLVDVGGYRLHLDCTGEATAGQPTVILETLSGGISAYWGWVQPAVAQTTRVCSYDRAGRAWSDPSPHPLTLEQTVTDLHTLLTNAGVPGPYVLVGHSIGGIYVREFATRYPDEVAGLVLVDAAHPQQFERFPALVAESDSYLRLSALFPWLARVGIFRLYFASGGTLDLGTLPAEQQAVAKAVWSSPAYFVSQRAEIQAAMQAGDGIYRASQQLGDLGDLPLAILSAGSHQPTGWAELQAELAQLSTDATHQTVAEATHASLAFDPAHAAITSRTILDVVARTMKYDEARR
jgi:pimeloyl-ACP methyl ester carboxylesterase